MPEPRPDARRPGDGTGLPGLLLRIPIRLYQWTLSPLVGRHCRYMPTCSRYADEAISRHGAWAGFWMAVARLARCHPWGASGFDPVPDELPAGACWYKPWRYGRRSGRHMALGLD